MAVIGYMDVWVLKESKQENSNRRHLKWRLFKMMSPWDNGRLPVIVQDLMTFTRAKSDPTRFTMHL